MKTPCSIGFLCFRRRFRCRNGFFSGNRLFLSLDLNQARYAGDPVAFAQFHDLDPFGGTADDPDFIHGDADDLSAFRGDDEFVTMLNFDCGDNLFTITEIEVLHTFCSAPGQAVIFHITAFSHAAGGDDEDLRPAGIFQCGIVIFITELFVDFFGGIFRLHDLFDTFGENRIPGFFRVCSIAGNALLVSWFA